VKKLITEPNALIFINETGKSTTYLKVASKTRHNKSWDLFLLNL